MDISIFGSVFSEVYAGTLSGIDVNESYGLVIAWFERLPDPTRGDALPDKYREISGKFDIDS